MSSIKTEENLKVLSTPVFKPDLCATRVEDCLSSIHHSFNYTPNSALDSTSLFSFLSKQLPHIQKQEWPSRVAVGGLYLNGRRTEQERLLSQKTKIEYYELKIPVSRIDQKFPSFSTDQIVYEDEYLAFVYKPVGLPTQPSRDQFTYSLRRQLEQHYKRRIHIPSRLDTATCGLLPVSIHPDAHKSLQRLFERRLVSKQYLCDVLSPPELPEFQVNAAIGVSSIHPILREVQLENTAPSASAITDIKVVDTIQNRTTILRVTPITGRTHQIRVHLAYFVGPIVGDPFYGTIQSDELHLICYQLSFFHPVLQKNLTIKVPQRLLPSWLPEESITKLNELS